LKPSNSIWFLVAGIPGLILVFYGLLGVLPAKEVVGHSRVVSVSDLLAVVLGTLGIVSGTRSWRRPLYIFPILIVPAAFIAAVYLFPDADYVAYGVIAAFPSIMILLMVKWIYRTKHNECTPCD
jgi:hypothetical protein